MNRKQLEQLDQWIQQERLALHKCIEANCEEGEEYCGKCKQSQCLWLMEEAFKE